MLNKAGYVTAGLVEACHQVCEGAHPSRVRQATVHPHACCSVSAQVTWSHAELLRGSGLPRSWVQDVVSRALPGELWGAVNVLAAASKGYSQAARPSPAPPQV